MYKLEQIRNLVEKAPDAYKRTKALVDDGCYDVGVLDDAMRQDLFTFEEVEFEPINPFSSAASKSANTISMEDLWEAQLKEELAVTAARQKAKDALINPGLNSCRDCISFIQSHGRNSTASKILVKELQPPYAKEIYTTIAKERKAKLGADC